MPASRNRRQAAATQSRRLEAFLEMLAAERGAARLTIAAYRNDLADLAGFLMSRGQSLETANAAALHEYLAAAGSAFIWASYSLLTRRVAHFPTAAVGLFGLVSGALALACHAALEPAVVLSGRDLALIALTGLGPLGAAFFLWDAALKRGDPRRIGILSYLTPLASTLLLALTSGRPLTVWIAVAALLIVGAAVIGMRAR